MFQTTNQMAFTVWQFDMLESARMFWDFTWDLNMVDSNQSAVFCCETWTIYIKVISWVNGGCLLPSSSLHSEPIWTSAEERWRPRRGWQRNEPSAVISLGSQSACSKQSFWSQHPRIPRVCLWEHTGIRIYKNLHTSVNIRIYQNIILLVSGWWLTYPCEKYASSSVGIMTFPTAHGKSFKIPWFQSPPTRS